MVAFAEWCKANNISQGDVKHGDWADGHERNDAGTSFLAQKGKTWDQLKQSMLQFKANQGVA